MEPELLEKRLSLGLGQRKDKMNLEHVEVTVTEELLKNEGMS